MSSPNVEVDNLSNLPQVNNKIAKTTDETF